MRTFMDFIFSVQAAEQMEKRNISMEITLEVLKNPKQVISNNDKDIYQSYLKTINNIL